MRGIDVRRTQTGIGCGAGAVGVRTGDRRRREEDHGPAPPAKKTPAPPPLTSAAAPSGTAFEGDGMWIWYVNQSNGGNVRSIANRAKAAGIETLFIKAGDGRKAWSQFNRGLVNKLHSYGLHVCGWQYVYGRWPASEAKVGSYAKRAGAECFVIDAEAEVEGKYAAA